MVFKKISVILLMLLGLTFTGNKASGESPGQEQSHEKGHEAGYFELKRGERIFNGMRSGVQPAVNCASCHNTSVIDTFNWNPDAYEIALSSSYFDSLQFTNSLLNPTASKRLISAHDGIELDPREIALVRLYLEDIAKHGLEKPKRELGRTLLIILVIVLINIAFVDLVFIRKIPWRILHIVIIVGGTIFIVQEALYSAVHFDNKQNYAPLQPIKFSHQVHAQQNGIDCQFCHHSAEFSKSAGIPPMSLCYNCHQLVREGTQSGKFEINKVIKAMEDSIPVEWIRIHKLPDHVFFSHAQHVGVAGLDCAECHGKVEEMDLLSQVETLGMGWCLECHRTRGVDFMENDYYTSNFEEYHEQLVRGELDSITPELMGGTDCMKCHY